MAKTNKVSTLEVENRKKRSTIIVNKVLRRGLTLLALVVTVFLFFTIGNNIDQGQSWLKLLLPIFCLGVPIVLFPQTESWSYGPWQSKVEKVERYFVD